MQLNRHLFTIYSFDEVGHRCNFLCFLFFNLRRFSNQLFCLIFVLQIFMLVHYLRKNLKKKLILGNLLFFNFAKLLISIVNLYWYYKNKQYKKITNMPIEHQFKGQVRSCHGSLLFNFACYGLNMRSYAAINISF